MLEWGVGLSVKLAKYSQQRRSSKQKTKKMKITEMLKSHTHTHTHIYTKNRQAKNIQACKF